MPHQQVKVPVEQLPSDSSYGHGAPSSFYPSSSPDTQQQQQQPPHPTQSDLQVLNSFAAGMGPYSDVNLNMNMNMGLYGAGGLGAAMNGINDMNGLGLNGLSVLHHFNPHSHSHQHPFMGYYQGMGGGVGVGGEWGQQQHPLGGAAGMYGNGVTNTTASTTTKNNDSNTTNTEEKKNGDGDGDSAKKNDKGSGSASTGNDGSADDSADRDNSAPDSQNKTNDSHESDEEAAATALLMAGGPRSENVEHMQAAVRKKKQRMMQLLKEQGKSGSGSKRKHVPVPVEGDHRPSSSNGSNDAGGDNNNNNKGGGIGEEREMKKRKKMEAAEEMRKHLKKEVSNSSNSATSVSSCNSGSSSNSHLAIVKEFPTVLHDVLTKSEYAGTVLEWLSHGKSWRILRWEEMCDSVIPAYFPELCRKGSGRDSKKTSSKEKMNMFIQQIKFWGFKEVREVGRDLGSFQHDFFMRVAPHLCKYMKIVVRKGSSSSSSSRRPTESGSKIVSPPRRGPKGRFSVHSSPALNPGFHHIPDAFRVKQRPPSSGDVNKRPLFTENREEVNEEASSPGNRSGPRCVSFQERPEDDSSIQSGHRQIRPPFESPRSHQEMHVNYVSPNSLTQWVGHSGEVSTPQHSPRLRLKSNRGGLRLSQSRVIESEDKTNRGSFPVSNRGRGNRSISSRGRSSKHRAIMRLENTQEPPMIIKKIENAEGVFGVSVTDNKETNKTSN